MKLVRLLERSSEPSAGASHSASLLRLRFSRFVNSLFSLTNEILRTLAQGYAATRVRNIEGRFDHLRPPWAGAFATGKCRPICSL